MTHLYYIHDPMCSWCYAFDSVLKKIESNLPQSVNIIKIVGGLAADSMEPMPEPLASMIQTNWKGIEKTVPHIQFNFDFWNLNQAIRSTYPSCRAVLAAKQQSPHFENKMITQIQWAYYQNAENPSLNRTLINCATRIGLDNKSFIADYNSKLVNDKLQQQIQFSRQLGVSTYPSLVLEIDNQISRLSIDYNDADAVINQILRILKKAD